MSTARRTYASLYDWIVYKRGSKAREKERRRVAAPLEAIYIILRSRDSKLHHVTAFCGNLTAVCQYRNMKVQSTEQDLLVASELEFQDED
jgi:hypothetical protein